MQQGDPIMAQQKIAIVTDSNSGISQAKAEKYGVYVLPMKFNINGVEYTEGISISHNEFYESQVNGAKIFTSQPSPSDVMDIWDEVLEKYDAIIHIPMASGLSSSFSTASMLASDYNGKVTVIDNQRITVTLKQAVLDAKALVDAGKSVTDIRNALTLSKDDASIYMMVDDLKYLKAGGRISPATAAIGTMLHIKPILSVNSGIIDSYDKARGTKAAKKAILKALEKDMINKFHDDNINNYHLYTAAALRRDEAIAWNEEVQDYFGIRSHIEAIPLSIATHVGIGTFGASLCKKMKIED